MSKECYTRQNNATLFSTYSQLVPEMFYGLFTVVNVFVLSYHSKSKECYARQNNATLFSTYSQHVPEMFYGLFTFVNVVVMS